MDRGSSVIVTELERALPSTVLTEYIRKEDSALFEAKGYHPPTIAKMLKSEGIFVSTVDEEWLSFIRNIRNLLVCSCWASSSKTRERNNTRDIRACVYSPVPENGNGEIKIKREYVWNARSITVQFPFAALFF